MTIEEITPTRQSTSYGSSNLKYYKMGKFLVITGTATTNGQHAGWVLIDILPEDITFKTDVISPTSGIYEGNTPKSTIVLRCHSNRNVSVQGNLNTTLYINTVVPLI